jgi:hypothetical protein
MNYDDQQLPKPKAIGDYLRPDRIPLLQPETQRRRPRSERAELIGYFTDRINDARQGTKFRLLRYAAVATKLKGWSVFSMSEAGELLAKAFSASSSDREAGA